MNYNSKIPLYFLLLYFIVLSYAQTYYFIGTGRGILTAVGNNRSELREIPFHPNTFNKGGQWWEFWRSPNYPNGEFIRNVYPGRVWDAEGYQSSVGTRVGLHPQKSGLDATKNQRWVWSPNNRIYLVMEYPWKYVNVTETGELRLDNLVSSQYQIFKRAPTSMMIQEIRNYLPDLQISVTVNTHGLFGNCNLENVRYQTLSVISAFTTNVTAANGTVLYRETKVPKIVFGRPTFPTGPHIWKFYLESPRSTNITVNMTFANGIVNGTEVLNGVAINSEVYGTYSANGDIEIIVGYVEESMGQL